MCLSNYIPMKLSRLLLIFSVALLTVLVTCQGQTLAQMSPNPSVDPQKYSFIVAGHAYGSHSGNNLGIYPKFWNNLSNVLGKKEIAFVIFTGDALRAPASEKAWQKAQEETDKLGLLAYFALGNHDNSDYGSNFLHQKFGATFYKFDIGSERFIILDSQKDKLKIDQDQLDFLKQNLESGENPKNIFILFHELLWNKNPKYRQVFANNRSRYGWSELENSNFWEEIFPLLQQYHSKNIYVIAGDTGGRPDSIPAFYEKLDNINLISSGMGEIKDENYILVNVENGNVSFKLIPLNEKNNLRDLEFYNLKNIEELNNRNYILQAKTVISSALKDNSYWYGFLTGLFLAVFVFAFVARRK